MAAVPAAQPADAISSSESAVHAQAWAAMQDFTSRKSQTRKARRYRQRIILHAACLQWSAWTHQQAVLRRKLKCAAQFWAERTVVKCMSVWAAHASLQAANRAKVSADSA